MDINFNSMGTKIASASADRTARVYNVSTGNCTSVLYGKIILKLGHDAEISRVIFNPQGTKIMTASADKTAIIWSA